MKAQNFHVFGARCLRRGYACVARRVCDCATVVVSTLEYLHSSVHRAPHSDAIFAARCHVRRGEPTSARPTKRSLHQPFCTSLPSNGVG